MLLKNCFTITVFVACSAALAGGCGGLRRLPLQRRRRRHRRHRRQLRGRGRGGRHGRQLGLGHGRQHGRQHNFDAGGGDAVFIDSGAVDVPVSNCVAGGACVPANPCHKGMFVCNEGAMTCMELTDMQANGTVCGTEHGLPQRDLRRVHRGHGVRRDRQAVPCRQHRLHDGRARLHGDGQQAERHELRHRDGLPGGDAARPARWARRASRRTGVTTGRWSARARRRPARTRTPTSPRAPPAARTWCATHGTLRRVRRRHDLRRSGQALQPGDDRLQHRHAGLHRIGQPTERDAVRLRHGLRNGNCAACSVGTLCQPTNPCHAGVTVCAPSIGCTDTGNVARQRRPVRHRSGLQRGNVRELLRGRELPADQPLQDGRDVVRDRLAGLHGVGQPGQRHDVRRQHGVQRDRQLRDLQRRRRLHADAIPCHTGTLTCSTGAPVCTDSGQNQPDGTICGANLVCRTGNCVVVRRESGLPADQPVQERRDVVRDRRVGLRGDDQQGRRARCAARASRARTAC